MRVDKWLWHARFFKTRALAAKMITGGHLRVDARKTPKSAHNIRVGETLTFIQAKNVRIIRINLLSSRRGPAPEAQTLYADLSPVPVKTPRAAEVRKGGRPTGKERRDRARFDARTLE